MRHVSSTETSESSTFYSTCRISSTSSRTSSDRSRCLDISFSTTCTVFVPVCTQVCTVFVPVCTQNSFRARCTVFVPVCTQSLHSLHRDPKMKYQDNGSDSDDVAIHVIRLLERSSTRGVERATFQNLNHLRSRENPFPSSDIYLILNLWISS